MQSPNFSVPTISSNTRIHIPKYDELESSLEIYHLNLYRKDSCGRRLHQQRSILVSIRSGAKLEEDIRALVDEINEYEKEEYFFEITPASEFYTLKKPQPPYDSGICSIQSPLVLARRSPKTGKVYADLNMQFCPHTSVLLNWFITANP